MKKVLTAMVAVSLLLCMILSFASCGESKPSGKYGAKELNLEFKGDKVSVNLDFTVLKGSASGTYEMDDDKIVITYDDDKVDAKFPTALTYDADKDAITCDLGFLGKHTLEKVK